MWNRFWQWLQSGTMPHFAAVPSLHLSRTIDLSRIALIVGLVFLHYGMYPNFRASPFSGVSVNEYEIAMFVNSFLLFFFFSVVPLLSMISGWLFFSFFDEPSSDPAAALSTRIHRRFESLYVPLVVWNFLYLAVLLALYTFVPDHPLFAALNIDFSSAGLKQYFNAVFAVDHHPLAFQFWFVRDLFLTILLSPLLWLLVKRVPYAAGAALFSAWLFNYDLEIFFRADVTFFFYAGAFIRLKRVEVGINARTTIVLCSVYLVLVTARALAPYIFDEATPLLAGFTRLMRLVGVLACWGLFLRLAETNVGASISRWGPFAFFLHAAHFPLMAELKLLLWNLLPEVNDFWMVTHYLISVALTIALCLGAAALLARYVPGLFGLLNGGRVPSLTPRSVGPPATVFG